MILGVHHVALSVPNLEEALAFYCGVLGGTQVSINSWEKGRRGTDKVMGLTDTAATVALVQLGMNYMEIFEFSSPPPKAQDPDRPACDHGLFHLCILVDDFMAECERLKAHGVRFHLEPEPGREMFGTYARDPFGNIFEILEITENSRIPNLAGA